MILLEQDPVGYKIVVHKKCLQKYRIVNISVLKFPMKMETYSTKTSKIFSNIGYSKQHSCTNFDPEIANDKLI